MAGDAHACRSHDTSAVTAAGVRSVSGERVRYARHRTDPNSTFAEANAAMRWLTYRSGTESTLISPRQESTDVRQVVQALSNGLRSDVEVAKTAHLALDRVHVALSVLVRHRCVVGSPITLFRLTDNGTDMVKKANAAERKLRR
jgi:hypothetical protein